MYTQVHIHHAGKARGVGADNLSSREIARRDRRQGSEDAVEIWDKREVLAVQDHWDLPREKAEIGLESAESWVLVHLDVQGAGGEVLSIQGHLDSVSTDCEPRCFKVDRSVQGP